MKTAISLLLASAFQLFSQGQLSWSSGPIYYGDSSKLASPANGPFWAMLFGGPVGSPVSALTSGIVSGGPVSVGDPTPGFVNGGTRSIAGIASGSPVTLQVRAWHASLGSSWESIPGVQTDGSTPGTGLSAPITMTLGGGAIPIPNTIGLGSFTITPIPEPSAILLLVLGVGGVVISRSRCLRKIFALISVLNLFSFQLFAQGTVNFANGGAGVNAPIYDHLGGLLGAPPFYPSDWRAMLFAGPAGTPAWALTDEIVSGSPVRQTTSPGYILGGARTIAGIPPGGQVVLQIRAWHVAYYGETCPIRDGQLLYMTGMSEPITITLGGEIVATPNMIGLQSFRIVVPEPAAISVFLVGCFALFLRRIIRRNSGD